MEFLRSLLRRRLARAQVATSRNVGYSWREPNEQTLYLVCIAQTCKEPHQRASHTTLQLRGQTKQQRVEYDL